MSDWFVAVDGKVHGPISASKLKKLADVGRIDQNTKVCKDGTEQWVAAARVGGLFAANEPTLPPLPRLAETATAAVPTQPVDAQPSAPATVHTGPATSSPPSPTALAAAHPTSSPSFPNVVTSASPNSSKRTFTSAALVTVGVVAIAAGALIAFAVTQSSRGTDAASETHASSGQSTNESAENPTSSAATDTGGAVHVEETIKQLKEQRDELEAETRTLKQQRDELQDDAQRLQKEIHELTETVSTLRHWQKPTVVMVNPSHVAVGIDINAAGKLVVTEELQGELVPLAIDAALKVGRMFIAAEPQLTREIANQFEPGDVITGPLEHRVRKHYRIHRPIPTDFHNPGQDSDWVYLIDQTSGVHHFGIHPRVEGDEVKFVSVNGGVSTVHRSAILPGSALRGPRGKILAYLNEGQFLDQCLLRTAVAVQSGETPDTHCVAVQVMVDCTSLP